MPQITFLYIIFSILISFAPTFVVYSYFYESDRKDLEMEFRSLYEKNEILLKKNIESYSKNLEVFKYFFSASTHLTTDEFLGFANNYFSNSDVVETCWHSESLTLIASLKNKHELCSKFDFLEPTQVISDTGPFLLTTVNVKSETQRGFVTLIIPLKKITNGITNTPNYLNFLLLKDSLKNSVIAYDSELNKVNRHNLMEESSVINSYFSEILRSNDLTFSYVSYMKKSVQLDTIQWVVVAAVFLVTSLFLNFLFFLFESRRRIELSVLQRTKELNREVQLRKQLQLKAEELAWAKSQFLANVSHEIRTPLNGILGSIQLAIKNIKDEETKDLLLLCKSSGDNLLSLLNDILDFSKLDLAQMRIEMRPYDLSKAILSVVHIFEPVAKEKGIQIHFEQDVVHRFYLGDETRFKQVTQNFLSNAIKFSPPGEIIVKLSSEVRDEDSDIVELSVKDNGIGIDDKFKQVIFTPFRQEDDSYVRRFGGTGLGLSICKKISELMGGEILLISEKGKGSTFCFKVPLRRTEEGMLENKQEFDLKGDLPSGMVLVVEDNEVNKVLMTKFLENLKVSFKVVSNGLEAVEAIRNDQYSLVLMDIQMPVMNGLEATRIIRQELSDIDLPIIALSANAYEDNIEECLRMGMQEFVSKPLNFLHLKSILHKYLNRANSL